ncbi:tetratricopeptide repeat protein 37 [Ditylenchus destructor]|uniref:Tetratricopeptide repeat protein 37 n=1 Tax=Ditylenchus destructor TaxID=166010 RepID=A0AAD4N2E5_9BILA|nr:tetratricopeptide repeat protein 37 [Ditylenchus destructor]
MSTPKNILKAIRELIDHGDNKKALDMIQEQLKAGMDDYALLLYAGYTHKELKNFQSAVEFFRKAIDKQREQLQAWQGLYKTITDENWDAPVDDFSLEVVDRLIQSSQSNSDKLADYKRTRQRFLLKLGKFDALLAEKETDLFPNADDRKWAITSLSSTTDKTEARELARRLIARAQQVSENDANFDWVLCTLRSKVSTYDEYSQSVVDHARRFFDHELRQIEHELYSIFGNRLLSSKRGLTSDLRELAELCSKWLSKPNSSLKGQNEFSAKVCKYLASGKLNEAFDFIMQGGDQIEIVPLLAVTLFIYRELGQFNKIIKLMDRIDIAFVPEKLRRPVQEVQIIAKFKLAENDNEFREIVDISKKTFGEDPVQFCSMKLKQIYFKSLIKVGEIRDAVQFETLLKDAFPEDDAVEGCSNANAAFGLRSFLNLHLTGNLDLAREQIRQAMTLENKDRHPADECEDILLLARILVAKGQRQLANTQLVLAAQKDPYNAEVFQVLAENMFATNTDAQKARACAERAKLLNPASEKIAKLLHDIYVKQNIDDSTRLSSLHSLLLERPNSEWALRQSALIEVNLGKLDLAVEKIQKLIRARSNATDSTPEGQFDESKREMCALWIFLSEAYKQKGNLQSAVRACKSALDIDPGNYTAKLQLIQLHQGMGHYELAIDIGTELLSPDTTLALAENLRSHAEIIHTHSLVLYVTDESRTTQEQMERLSDIFDLLAKLLQESSTNCVLLQKMVAQMMGLLLSFNDCILTNCIDNLNLTQFPFPINSRLDVFKCKIRCLTRIVNERPTANSVWNELALAFLALHQHQPDEKLLDKCVECLRNAILSTKSRLKRSEYWCTLGKIFLQAQDNYPKAQHCLIRAIQLNKHSDSAWCLLALLYLKLNLLNEALRAMNQAQKINPQLMEAWIAHALHADLTNDPETMDLFRHSIVLKPTETSIRKYAYYLMNYLRAGKVMDEGTMINFDTIKDLYYRCEHENHFMHAIALLAEHFWYLDEAASYVNSIKDHSLNGLETNRTRIHIKSQCNAPNCSNQSEHIKSLKKLYDMSLSDLKDLLLATPPMKSLFNAISLNDVAEFGRNYKSNYYPLLATSMIVFNLTLTPEIFAVVESVRPLHKLADVYPPGMQSSKPEELLCQQQSEEDKVMVRHDHLSDKLFELLKQQSEQDPTSNAEVTKESSS